LEDIVEEIVRICFFRRNKGIHRAGVVVMHNFFFQRSGYNLRPFILTLYLLELIIKLLIFALVVVDNFHEFVRKLAFAFLILNTEKTRDRFLLATRLFNATFLYRRVEIFLVFLAFFRILFL
jgi:hypothetical protein